MTKFLLVGPGREDLTRLYGTSDGTLVWFSALQIHFGNERAKELGRESSVANISNARSVPHGYVGSSILPLFSDRLKLNGQALILVELPRKYGPFLFLLTKKSVSLLFSLYFVEN